MIRIGFKSKVQDSKDMLFRGYPDSAYFSRNNSKGQVILFDPNGVVTHVFDSQIVGVAIKGGD